MDKKDIKPIVTLTEIDKDKKVVITPMGTLNQMTFARVSDALQHLFIKTKADSTITIKRTSENFAWVTVEKPNIIMYYELQTIEPIHYE